jgi:predicted glycosyltransferase
MGTEVNRPRVLVYSSDGHGLGHVRITLPIAAELARRRPEALVLLATGAWRIDVTELPANLDVLKLPTAGRESLYRHLAAGGEGIGARFGVWGLRAGILTATCRLFAPHLVFVDSSPAGSHGELKQGLLRLHEAEPRPAIVLGLPDLVTDPETVLEEWRFFGGLDLLDRVYDRVVVYGDRAVYDPVAEYRFSPALAGRTDVCGYLPPAKPTASPEAVRARLGADDRPLVVVTTGGGEDGLPLLRAYVTALRAGLQSQVVSFVTTGPLMKPSDRAEIEDLSAGLPDLTLVPFAADLIDFYRAADVVVTMGGYGSVRDALALAKRPIVVPRAGHYAEHRIRAARLERLGLATVVSAETLSPERLTEAVRAELAADSSPPRLLDFDGLRRVTDVLLALLDERAPHSD